LGEKAPRLWRLSPTFSKSHKTIFSLLHALILQR
jgi:hypothetical protein